MPKKVKQHERECCYFCGSEGPIQTHHIVPQRLGGRDMPENLVDLCPTCHQRLEQLYGDKFYETLGTTDDRTELMVSVLEYIRSRGRCGRHELTAAISDEFDIAESKASSILSDLVVKGVLNRAEMGVLEPV